MVDKVVPYLPMDPASNLLVIELKLERLAETLDGGLYTTSGRYPRSVREKIRRMFLRNIREGLGHSRIGKQRVWHFCWVKQIAVPKSFA